MRILWSRKNGKAREEQEDQRGLVRGRKRRAEEWEIKAAAAEDPEVPVLLTERGDGAETRA